MNLRDHAQMIRLGGNHYYLLSDSTSPIFLYLNPVGEMIDIPNIAYLVLILDGFADQCTSLKLVLAENMRIILLEVPSAPMYS